MTTGTRLIAQLACWKSDALNYISDARKEFNKSCEIFFQPVAQFCETHKRQIAVGETAIALVSIYNAKPTEKLEAIIQNASIISDGTSIIFGCEKQIENLKLRIKKSGNEFLHTVFNSLISPLDELKLSWKKHRVHSYDLSPIQQMPSEVLAKIFGYLDIEDQIRFQFVCKDWNRLYKSRDFRFFGETEKTWTTTALTQQFSKCKPKVMQKRETTHKLYVTFTSVGKIFIPNIACLHLAKKAARSSNELNEALDKLSSAKLYQMMKDYNLSPICYFVQKTFDTYEWTCRARSPDEMFLNIEFFTQHLKNENSSLKRLFFHVICPGVGIATCYWAGRKLEKIWHSTDDDVNRRVNADIQTLAKRLESLDKSICKKQ